MIYVNIKNDDIKEVDNIMAAMSEQNYIPLELAINSSAVMTYDYSLEQESDSEYSLDYFNGNSERNATIYFKSMENVIAYLRINRPALHESIFQILTEIGTGKEYLLNV